MRLTLLLFLLLFSTCVIKAQDKFQQNDVYFEAFGNGLAASLNYEHQFSNKPGLGFRFGLGFYGDQAFFLTVPIGLDYLIPLKGNRSFLDAGLGATFTSEEVMDLVMGERHKHAIIIFIPSLGYRRHTKNLLMYRGSVSAVIWEGGVYPYFGLSFGLRF